MFHDLSQIPPFLKELTLFSALDDSQIIEVASLFTVERRIPDELIIVEGEQGDSFYIIFEGKVAVSHRINENDVYLDVLEDGDFFGEEALLLHRPRSASVRAVSQVVLLQTTADQFNQLVAAFPSVKDNLVRFLKSRQFVRTHHFNWLNEDEVVYQVRRRHLVVLLQSMIWPLVISLVGLAVVAFALLNWNNITVRNAGLILAAVILGIGLGWSIWKLIDWGNDFYLVTNQRVVWFERVIWLYESRMEAPLDTLLSINVTTEFIGRLLGFGNVIVTTYTGRIDFKSVSNPYQLASLIREYWNRSKRNMQKTDHKDTQKSIQRMLGHDEIVEERDGGIKRQPLQKHLEEAEEPGFWSKYFGNVFKTRFEVGNVVTYRKHWYVLLKKAGWPTLLGLILFFLVVSFDIMYLLGKAQFVSPSLLNGVAFILFAFVILPWWLYNYVDWRNDIYQLTDKSIFDIERKPFGTEVKKSASLENILSLEHERPGFLGYFLNVGSVEINVGEAKLTFENVFEPARVQQDIFNRMHAIRIKKQKDEIARERDRIISILEIYHQEVDQEKPDTYS